MSMQYLRHTACRLGVLLVMAPVICSQDSEYEYQGTGVYVEYPTGTTVTVTPGVPVAPGGPGTRPGQIGEMGGWNGSFKELEGEVAGSTPQPGAESFAKLLSVDVQLNGEGQYEAQGKAAVGGLVSAQLINAHGSCHAYGASKTAIVYGGQKAEAKDAQLVALAHTGSGLLGLTFTLGGVGFGVTTTYTTAGNQASTKILADQDTGQWAETKSATVDYVQKGDMAYSIQQAVPGPSNNQAVAKTELEVTAKGTAVIKFRLVPAD